MQSSQGSLRNHPRLTQAFSHPEHNLNIIHWKDIRTLSKAEQLRFWSCMIYLFIMPPKHLNQKGEPLWVYQTLSRTQQGKQKNYTPQCRYDQFIASHATCCEHHTNYFAHYHRHLIVQYVLALNQADFALRNRESKQAREIERKMVQRGLQRQYSAAIKFYNEYVMKMYEQELEEDEYDLQQMPWVTPAYWNIFDYEHKIELPGFLRKNRPKDGENPFLDLFKAYKKCEFGQYNFKETWNQGTEDLSYFWRQRYIKLEAWQKDIISGKADRSQYMKLRTYIRQKILQSNYGKFINNLYERDSQSNSRQCKSDLILLSDQQINFQYGGKGLEYFTENQSNNSFTIQSANMSIPYYQYARALLTPFHNFCIPTDSNMNMNKDGYLCGNNSLSLPHDMMHDNLGYPTSDGSFSIMSPMFMLYHGFVEYMSEQYLRLIEKYDKNNKYAYKSLKVFLDMPVPMDSYRYTEQQRAELLQLKNAIQLAVRNNQVVEERRLNERYKWLKRNIVRGSRQKKSVQPGFGGFLAEFQQQNAQTFKTNGDYPIFQWTLTGSDYDEFTYDQQPIIEDVHYSAFGTYRQFMLNQQQTGIRYSDQLYQFYQKYISELKMPQQLIDQGYPFSFTFDIIEDNKHKDPPLPDYLYRIQNDIQQSNIAAEMEAALRVKKVSSGIPMPIVQPQTTQNIKNGMKFMFRNSISQDLGPSRIHQGSSSLKIEQIQNLTYMKKKRKQFLHLLEQYSSLYCRIEHVSNLKNATIMLSMKIRDTKGFNFSNSGELGMSSIKDKIINSDGLIGTYPYTVFGKGQLAVTCPRCRPRRTEKFNLFKYLTGQLNPVLLDLHVNINVGILYNSLLEKSKSKVDKQKYYQKQFAQIVQISHDYPHQGFKIEIISGAIQTNFKILFCKDLNDPNSLLPQPSMHKHQIRITAQSYNLSNNTLFASLLAKRKSLNTEIVFEELIAPSEMNMPEKQLVYKNFKVIIIIDKEQKYKEEDGGKGNDVIVRSFQFKMRNFAIEAYYDIRVNQDYEVLVIDSNIEGKKDIFY